MYSIRTEDNEQLCRSLLQSYLLGRMRQSVVSVVAADIDEVNGVSKGESLSA